MKTPWSLGYHKQALYTQCWCGQYIPLCNIKHTSASRLSLPFFSFNFQFPSIPPDADVVSFPLGWPVAGTADIAPYTGTLPLHEYLCNNQENNSGSHLLEYRQNQRGWVHSHLSLEGKKNAEGITSVLPPSLWEEPPVPCWQHHVRSPLSWASSPQAITLWHQELTLNSLYCFLRWCCPRAWPTLCFKICTTGFCCAWPWTFNHKQSVA